METRVFGRDTSVRVIQDGNLLSEFSAVDSWTFDVNVKRVEEGYIGETANRQDEIYESVSGSIPIKVEGPDALRLQEAIALRATRRSNPQVKIDLVFRISFPNGVIARIAVKDVKFETVPLNQGGRESYLAMTLNWKAPSFRLI